MSELNIQRSAASSIWRNNPSLVYLMGLSPLLAVSVSATHAIGLGAGTLAVCSLSAVTLYLTRHLSRRHLPQDWNLLWCGILLAAYTSVLDLILQLFFFQLSSELGIYVLLIACNFALVLKMEDYRLATSLPYVILDSIKLGVGLMLALVLFAAIRELLISGTVLHNWQLLIPGDFTPAVPDSDSSSELWGFAASPPMGFILLGLLIGILKRFGGLDCSPLSHRSDQPVQRARVTGRLNRED